MMTPAEIQEKFAATKIEANKALVGMDKPFEILFAALLTGGHVLLEGVPGTAKTLMAKTLSLLIEAEFTRIQFTPDLMPSDILGTTVFEMGSGTFYLKKGPIFTQICLADEINRAPAKTQSALLEAMEEKQINLDGENHRLEEPFMVVATQNPVEYEGTYPLPEAQLDRFLFKIVIPYATEAAEVEVLRRYHTGFSAIDLASAGIKPVLSTEFILQARQAIQQIKVEDGILHYITAIVRGSRHSSDVVLGAGTRAATHILLASKTLAAIHGRDFVTPDDVKTIVPYVLRHRLILQPETEIEGLGPDAVIQRILAEIEVPR